MNKPADPLLTIPALPPLGRARQVAEALSAHIDRARLGPGDRLPAERELMAGARRRPLDHPRGDPPVSGARRRRDPQGQRHLSAASRSRRATDPHAAVVRRRSDLRDACCRRWRCAAASRSRPAWSPPPGAARAEDLADIEAKLDEMERVHLRQGHVRPGGSRLPPGDLRRHATIRCSGSCWSRCARPSSGSGRSPSTGRISPRRSFPFHRTLFDAIARRGPRRRRRARR